MITLSRGGLLLTDQLVDIRVTTAAEYVAARKAIRDCRRAGTDLHIHVPDVVMQHWFWDLEGQRDFQEQSHDLRQDLEGKLNATLPPEITADVIEQLDLLSEDDPENPITNVTLWIASVHLGAVWGSPEPGKEHVRELIAWLIEQDLSQMPPSLFWVMKACFRFWETVSDGTLKRLYAALRLQREETVRFLCAWDTLSTYSEKNRKTWLEHLGLYSQEREEFTEDLGNLPPNPVVDRELKNLIVPYWNQRLNQKFKEVMNAGQ